jgi:secreted trypsin-like serine protease
MRRHALAFVLAAALTTPAAAIVGGSAGERAEPYTVLIVSTARGSICSGTAIGRDLVITAAHCVVRRADYAIVRKLAGTQHLVPVARVALHPGFSADSFRTHKPTPDLALLKTALPLPQTLRPAALARENSLPRPGDRFLIAGWGQGVEGDDGSVGILRTLSLPAVGTTGGIMVRLSAGTRGGSCDGDSGGSVFRDSGRGLELAGVIGWATGPAGRGCGAVTGATLIGIHSQWIAEAAKSLGGHLGE